MSLQTGQCKWFTKTLHTISRQAPLTQTMKIKTKATQLSMAACLRCSTLCKHTKVFSIFSLSHQMPSCLPNVSVSGTIFQLLWSLHLFNGNARQDFLAVTARPLLGFIRQVSFFLNARCFCQCSYIYLCRSICIFFFKLRHCSLVTFIRAVIRLIVIWLTLF